MLFSRKQKKSERATEHAQALAALEQAAKNALPKVAVCVHGKCETCSYKASCTRYHSKKGRL